MKDFYQGKIYGSSWITKAIEKNKDKPMEIGGNKMIAVKEDSFICQCESTDCKKLNISRKKKFTIVEGLRLFQIMSTNNSETMNKISFWQKIQDNKYIPERAADLMKKFWAKYESYTVE